MRRFNPHAVHGEHAPAAKVLDTRDVLYCQHFCCPQQDRTRSGRDPCHPDTVRARQARHSIEHRRVIVHDEQTD